MTAAAEHGARKAVLALLGVEEHDADLAKDFRELRDLVDAWRGVKVGMWRGVGRFLTWALVVAMVVMLGNFNLHSFLSPPLPPGPVN
jgi:hypothetical protein